MKKISKEVIALKRSLKVLVDLIPILSYVLVLVTPYITIVAVKQAYSERGYWAMGGEYLVPLVLFVLALAIRYLYSLTQEKSDELKPPTHDKRFTKKSKHGASIDTADIYEIVVYLDKVEDYFERIGVPYEK